jgi:hypothetical protein
MVGHLRRVCASEEDRKNILGILVSAISSPELVITLRLLVIPRQGVALKQQA